MGEFIHITPGPTPTLRHYGTCPFCEREAHIVGLTQDWYDTEWCCCRCGDSWTVMGRNSRPFERAWRQRAIKQAARSWWRALLGAAA